LRTLELASVLLNRVFQDLEDFANAFKDNGDRKQQHTKQRGQSFPATIQKYGRLTCEFLLCLGHMLPFQNDGIRLSIR